MEALVVLFVVALALAVLSRQRLTAGAAMLGLAIAVIIVLDSAPLPVIDVTLVP